MMRDFSRDAPGRMRNSASKSNAAAAQRRLKEKNFTVPSRKIRGGSSHELERPLPACLVEEVHDHFAQEQKAIAPGGLQILVVRSLKRPVNEHGPSNDIFLRNESPVPA